MGITNMGHVKSLDLYVYYNEINWWRQNLYTSRSYKDLRWFY